MEYRRLYIAYGSNINIEQMANRCPNSKVIGKEMLKGYELEFRGVATIVPKENAEVPVLIWEIDVEMSTVLTNMKVFRTITAKSFLR